jgi:hypothetical protein
VERKSARLHWNSVSSITFRHQGKVFTRDALLDAVWGDLQFVTPRSVVTPLPDRGDHPVDGTKDQLHYLLHQERALEVPSAVLETAARIGGGIVLDRASNFLAFGAIIRHPDLAEPASGKH